MSWLTIILSGVIPTYLQDLLPKISIMLFVMKCQAAVRRS